MKTEKKVHRPKKIVGVELDKLVRRYHKQEICPCKSPRLFSHTSITLMFRNFEIVGAKFKGKPKK